MTSVRQRQANAAWQTPAFQIYACSPQLASVPAAMLGEKQRHWAGTYRCPEAYKVIDKWCAENGHRDMVACLAHLHQQLRLLAMHAAKHDLGPWVATTSLLGPRRVKSHRRHRSTSVRNRMALICRQLRLLAAIGLVIRARGRVQFVDVSERIADLRSVIYPEAYNVFRISRALLRCKRHLRVKKKGHLLKILQGGRGSASRTQPRTAGRFAARTPQPAPTFRPEAGPAPAMPATARSHLPFKRLQADHAPQARIPSPVPAKTTHGPQAAGQAQTPGRLDALRGKSVAELRAMQAAAFASEGAAPTAPTPRQSAPRPVQSAARVVVARTAPLPPDPRLADDDERADGAWLGRRYSLHKHMCWLLLLRPTLQKATRGEIRRADALLISHAPGAVKSPQALFLWALSRIQAKKLFDPRKSRHFRKMPGW